MSYYQRLEEMNYMAEEAEMVDFVDDGGAAAAAGGVEDVEADEYELVFILNFVSFFLFFSLDGKVLKLIYFFVKNNNNNDQITKVTDTSSGQARNGQDIQGIPWERLNISRENYRSTRLEQYKNYENIPLSGEAVDKVL